MEISFRKLADIKNVIKRHTEESSVKIFFIVHMDVLSGEEMHDGFRINVDSHHSSISQYEDDKYKVSVEWEFYVDTLAKNGAGVRFRRHTENPSEYVYYSKIFPSTQAMTPLMETIKDSLLSDSRVVSVEYQKAAELPVAAPGPQDWGSYKFVVFFQGKWGEKI